MKRGKPIMPIVASEVSRQSLLRIALLVAVLAVCAALVACEQTATEAPDSDYGATAGGVVAHR